MTTLPMQYFGRGSARMMMPRAVARHERREWPVSPSFLILLLSLAFLSLHRLMMDRPLTLKRTRTLILMPHTPPLPSPTIKESLPFFTVVKEAARKSRKPREKVPSQVLQPKKTVVEKQAIPKPPKEKQTVPPLPLPKALTPLQPNAKRPIAPLTKAMAKPRPVLTVGKEPPIFVPTASIRLRAGATNVPRRRGPTANFSPLPMPVPRTVQTFQGAIQPPKKRARLGSFQVKDPAPLLTQLPEAPRELTKTTIPKSPQRPSSVVPPIQRAEMTHSGHLPPVLRLKKRAQNAKQGETHRLVQIKGSHLGASLRVRTLKEEIYRKSRLLSFAGSPYTYRIGPYQCRVIIGHGERPVTTLIFDPTDAPFDVVSALERLLPRRAMHP